GNGAPLPWSQQPLQKIQIDGFFPIIMNVAPVDLPKFFSFEEDRDDSNDERSLITASENQ
ncbi:MAG: hypothetical protein NUV91_01750, partial [Candidatus Omnitrophica bacterium]|nr:hypothetical protein [Candidatus Omnitrophota bacterium]